MIKIDKQVTAISGELSELKTHLRNIAKLAKSKLMAHFKTKKQSLIKNVNSEYAYYIKQIYRLSKLQIIERAEEISQMQNIHSYFLNNTSDCTGLLIERNALLLEIYSTIAADEDADFSEEYIKITAQKFEQELTKDAETIDKCLQPYRQELKATKSCGIKSVTITLISEKSHTLSLSLDDFYSYLDRDLLDRFAVKSMADFPTKNYFGEAGAETFEALRKLRFCKNLQKNYKANIAIGKDGGIIRLDSMNKAAYFEDGYSGITDRYILKDFVEKNYENPQLTINNIITYFCKYKDIINGVHKMIGVEK